MTRRQLFAAADADELATDEAIDAQITRMLADTKADALADAFAGQWLNFRSLANHEVDATAFGGYSAALVASMQAEARRYFLEFARTEDLPVRL